MQDFETMTTEELRAFLDSLDVERLKLKETASIAAAVYRRRLAEENRAERELSARVTAEVMKAAPEVRERLKMEFRQAAEMKVKTAKMGGK